MLEEIYADLEEEQERLDTAIWAKEVRQRAKSDEPICECVSK